MSVELIFQGTATSSCLPNINCLTEPPEKPRCMACWTASHPELGPEALKNRRRNTSGVVRTRGKDGKEVVILIDAGKSFIASAIEWFPKYGLRRIDGLLLTHAHADAMNGLDDLRCAWTLRGAIQSHIDIYLSQKTFGEVQRTFPYLVDKGQATGGGDVPDFDWHLIEENVEFEIEGVKITPILVHHGRIFQSQPNQATPEGTRPVTPAPRVRLAPLTVAHQIEQAFVTTDVKAIRALTELSEATKPETMSLLTPLSVNGDLATSKPYPTFGFLLPHILYISDVSDIPASTFDFLATRPKPSLMVVDCLRPLPHTSHFGFTQAVEAARKLGAKRTYFVGFACGGGSGWMRHSAWVQMCEAIGRGDEEVRPDAEDADPGETERMNVAMKLVQKGERVWVRPAFDGLKVTADENGVWDEAYD